ncbi:major royal jelly protein 1 [Diachasma alloeum]|uniref:major royal jelly protein 1 n=1 Tax=Diachasma alloeum TaxID=454923 RepID=UPI0010FB65FE|nr:major royal jelly protein 1 [Diachasma alloeum]
MHKYLWFLSFLCSAPVINAGKLQVLYEWSWIDYLWESEAHKAAAILSGQYNYTKPVIIDVDVWNGRKKKYRNNFKTFVTVVRRPGVPASLTTVSEEFGYGGPLLAPYPNWNWAVEGDCYGITSVFRVAIDECDRLWVLDTGKIEEEHVCPAQLLAFDLHTDRLLKRVKIPRSIARNAITKQGLFVTPVVETEGLNCKKTHVYMADTTGNGLVIYNGTTLWRLESPAFASQEAAANFTVAGEHFYLDDGVLGMALSPPVSPQENYRYLMLRPLASYDMVSAETSNLHDSHSVPVRYTLVSRALPSQAAGMAFSASGVLFFGLIQQHAIACWNMHKTIAPENIVILDHDIDYYQFVSGVKVIPKHITERHEELWIATNRYQKIALDVQDFNDINFRIMSRRLDRLIRGTNCDPRSNFEHFFSDAEDIIWDYSRYLWALGNAKK